MLSKKKETNEIKSTKQKTGKQEKWFPVEVKIKKGKNNCQAKEVKE